MHWLIFEIIASGNFFQLPAYGPVAGEAVPDERAHPAHELSLVVAYFRRTVEKEKLIIGQTAEMVYGPLIFFTLNHENLLF
jgi:hypothetical protein